MNECVSEWKWVSESNYQWEYMSVSDWVSKRVTLNSKMGERVLLWVHRRAVEGVVASECVSHKLNEYDTVKTETLNRTLPNTMANDVYIPLTNKQRVVLLRQASTACREIQPLIYISYLRVESVLFHHEKYLWVRMICLTTVWKFLTPFLIIKMTRLRIGMIRLPIILIFFSEWHALFRQSI